MFCASPSGLRRWTWDNDTSTAKLGAMGDVAWGKVGAGALHYNVDGQQVAMKKNERGEGGGSNLAKTGTKVVYTGVFFSRTNGCRILEGCDRRYVVAVTTRTTAAGRDKDVCLRHYISEGSVGERSAGG